MQFPVKGSCEILNKKEELYIVIILISVWFSHFQLLFLTLLTGKTTALFPQKSYAFQGSAP
jgi:hypothetical protein